MAIAELRSNTQYRLALLLLLLPLLSTPTQSLHIVSLKYGTTRLIKKRTDSLEDEQTFHPRKAFIAARIDYEFKNVAYLSKALDTTGLSIPESNQRLALLGNKIIPYVLADRWYTAGTAKVDGHDEIVRIGGNANLAKVARDIGLGQHVSLHPPQRVTTAKLLATTAEAIIAAIYWDSDKNIDTVKAAMENMGLLVTTNGSD